MKQSLAPALKIAAPLLGTWGLLLLLTPLMAFRPDGIIATHRGASPTVVLALIALIGAVMALAAVKVWRGYSPRAMPYFWAALFLGLAATPFAIFLSTHYGK